MGESPVDLKSDDESPHLSKLSINSDEAGSNTDQEPNDTSSPKSEDQHKDQIEESDDLTESKASNDPKDAEDVTNEEEAGASSEESTNMDEQKDDSNQQPTIKSEDLLEAPQEYGPETTKEDLEEDDEFGDFDEFDDYEEAQPETPAAQPEPVQVSDVNAPKPSTTSQVRAFTVDEIRNVLKPPAGLDLSADEIDLGDGTTPTSQQLWQHLTEPSWIPSKRWEGSLSNKQSAVNLGIPQNSDSSLPKHESKQSSSPIGKGMFEEIESLKKVPEWSSLADVSPSAVEGMTIEESTAHVGQLQAALDEARASQDQMQSREMDFNGEKSISEGMVESSSVFSQRNQRERSKHKNR